MPLKNPRPKLRSPPSHLPSSPLPLSRNPTSSKMPLFPRRHSFLRPTLILSCLFFFYVFYSFLYHPPSPTTSRLSLNNEFIGGIQNAPPHVRKVRVFMYDLPRRFTYGVIEDYAAARGGKAAVGKDGMLKYPGHQHSAEWYLFTDLNRPEHERADDSAVIRVMDPEEADLFYVPFFSSLSLVVNPIRPAATLVNGSVPRPTYSDEETQEALIDWLGQQEYWRRNNGWDHVIICQDPNALFKGIDRVKNGVLLVSDFGRLGRNQASLVKDVILPYSHRINPYKGELGVDNRNTLLFFMGNRYRKEGGKIRDKLFQLLEKEEDVIIKHGAQSMESRREATRGMHSSKFCLHPAGDTPSACRLFDAIVSLCVPVIVSEYIELPFEDVIDYKKIAIFTDTSTAVAPGNLVKLLRGVSSEKILEYQKELQKVKRYFEYDNPNGMVKEIWRQVSSKAPLVKLMINREKRLVTRELGDEGDCACICSNRTGMPTIL